MATLYGMSASINCHTPWLCLEEGKVPYTFQVVNIMAGEQMSPDFLAMNPMHAVPTFKDADGFTLWESNTIARYVANKYKLEQFYPTDPARRARIDQALDWRQNTFYKKVGPITYPTLFGFGSADEAAKLSKEIATDFDVLANYFLKDTKFISGETPSIADFAIAPCFKFLEASPSIEIPARLQEYYSNFKAAVPSFEAKLATDLNAMIASKK